MRLRDLDTGNILFESENAAAPSSAAPSATIVRFGVEVGIDGEQHLVPATNTTRDGQEVLIQFPVGTLGDILGWFPYAAKFQERMAAG